MDFLAHDPVCPSEEGRGAASAALLGRGFACLDPSWLDQDDKGEWAAFANSWNDLPLDDYMADGGRYRRRRYAAFHLRGGELKRLPHQPHYQDRHHNPLNGGIERWFAPIEGKVAASPCLERMIRRAAALFADAEAADWQVEVHQFRIEAELDHPGLPTPEGMHADGRDRVLIAFIGGHDITGGETRIADRQGRELARLTLETPGEALLLDDRRLLHGTTPIETRSAGGRGWRDTLVVTFLRSA